VMAYKKAPFFEQYIEGLEQILIKKTYAFLTDLNTDILVYLLQALCIDIPLVKASDYDFVGKKSDLVLNMCKKLGASKFIFGALGKNYANFESFTQAGIQVYFQDYQHPVYNQLYGDFLPNMSVIDLLFNEGPQSKALLLQGNILSVD
jgi:hypothetical protein